MEAAAITIRFHKSIIKYTDISQHTFYGIDSYLDLMKACMEIFPKLEKAVMSFLTNNNKHEELCFLVNGKLLNVENLWFPPKKEAAIVLCPLLYGGDKVVKIVAIIIIVTIIILQPELAFTFSASGSFTGLTFVGQVLTNIAFQLVTSLLAPSPPKLDAQSAPDAGARRNNDVFDGLSTSNRSGIPIFITYGVNRVAGHFISGYITSISHGKEDIVQVGELFSQSKPLGNQELKDDS